MKTNTFEETVTLPLGEKCTIAIVLTMHFLLESFNPEQLYQSVITMFCPFMWRLALTARLRFELDLNFPKVQD